MNEEKRDNPMHGVLHRLAARPFRLLGPGLLVASTVLAVPPPPPGGPIPVRYGGANQGG